MECDLVWTPAGCPSSEGEAKRPPRTVGFRVHSAWLVTGSRAANLRWTAAPPALNFG
jgi:hypothetical protein